LKNFLQFFETKFFFSGGRTTTHFDSFLGYLKFKTERLMSSILKRTLFVDTLVVVVVAAVGGR
jgi:hypothetical protein